MLDAYHVAKPVDSFGAAPEVAEFSCAIQAGGIPYDMVMRMMLVYMSRNNESVISLQET